MTGPQVGLPGEMSRLEVPELRIGRETRRRHSWIAGWVLCITSINNIVTNHTFLFGSYDIASLNNNVLPLSTLDVACTVYETLKSELLREIPIIKLWENDFSQLLCKSITHI